MRMIKLIIVIVVVFLNLGLWLGVNGNSELGERNMNYGIAVMTDKMSYAVGEPIKMTLKVFNYTKEDITFHFNTVQRYDFIIEDEKGNDIWRWSKDRMFAMVLGEEILGPTNSEVIYTGGYTDKLSPGYYKVTGFFVARDRPMSGSIVVEVK